MAAKTANSAKGTFQPDPDVHVTFEDQQKINVFAKQNARLEDLKEELKVRQNDLKSLEEASDEIELFDDTEQIPFLLGEVFISHNLPKTQELLVEAKEKKKKEIKEIETKCKELGDTIADLKNQLYGRFGSHIYLENED
ncbi:Prefoldin subunit 4 [Sergentomyia squamirostris]